MPPIGTNDLEIVTPNIGIRKFPGKLFRQRSRFGLPFGLVKWIEPRVLSSLFGSSSVHLGRIDFPLSMRRLIMLLSGCAQTISGQARRLLKPPGTRDTSNPEGEVGGHRKLQHGWQYFLNYKQFGDQPSGGGHANGETANY